MKHTIYYNELPHRDTGITTVELVHNHKVLHKFKFKGYQRERVKFVRLFGLLYIQFAPVGTTMLDHQVVRLPPGMGRPEFVPMHTGDRLPVGCH